MRRLLFSLLAASLMTTVTGCRATHGVCDCGCDFENSCSHRAPWVNEAMPKTEVPTPMPDVRQPLPEGQKRL
jgi:hypothetical protein